MPGRLVGVSVDATATRPTAWRCRRASSTSAARRRPPTSARRRCCRRWCEHVRRLPRPRGLEAHRAPRGELHRDARRRAEALAPPSAMPPPSTPSASPPARTEAVLQTARDAGMNLRRARPTRWASRSTKPPRATTSSAVGAVRAGGALPEFASFEARRRAADPGCRWRAAAPSSRTRCSTATTARPRCCATCAAWPTRIWRSTAR